MQNLLWSCLLWCTKQ